MDNKRIEDLERITKRLMRRAGKRTAALITPYPISAASFGERVEGPILRYMFPCDGEIIKGIVKTGSKPKNPVLFEIKVFNDFSSASKGFALDRKSLSISPNLPVRSGDCLEISLKDGEEIVTEVWISILWKPTMKDIEVKSFLIEELENDIQKREDLITE
jgi:hypothetical protein